MLLAALGRIPPEYAEVIRYHFLHDLPHQKNADFLGVPLSTVKWRCFRVPQGLHIMAGPEQIAQLMLRTAGLRPTT